MKRTPAHRVALFAVLIAGLAGIQSAPAAAFVDGQPRIQFGDTLYVPIYPCAAIVIEPRQRKLTIYCDGPNDQGDAVLRFDWERLEGPAISTGWTVDAELAIVHGPRARLQATGCEIVAPSDIRCDGFSNGFEQ